MKILFIYPGTDVSYPLQLGALSAYIKRSGHESMLLSLEIPQNLDRSHYYQVNKTIKTFQPNFIGFSAYEMAFNWIKSLSRYIKRKYPKIKIVIGGYMATLAPKLVISNPFIDIICQSEGEQPLLELLSNPKKTDIQNLWFKKGKKIIKNKVRPLMIDLDSLPYPDRDMLDYQSQLNCDKIGDRTVKIMASRGCPYNCTYCSNFSLRAATPNPQHYLRLRKPQNVIDEIKYLKTKFQFEKVGFHDDNLTLNINWLKEFVKIYRRQINLPFYCSSRVEHCTPEILSLLKSAGCELLLIGIESGDEKYRSHMMKRHMSNIDIISAFRLARIHGIKTWSFTMVGLPEESKLMLLKTIWLNWLCKPDFVMASIYYPLHGTEMGELCYQKKMVNLKKQKKVFTYAWDSVLNHPNMSPSVIRLAKYLNIATAIRSPLFWHLFFQRFRDYVHA